MPDCSQQNGINLKLAHIRAVRFRGFLKALMGALVLPAFWPRWRGDYLRRSGRDDRRAAVCEAPRPRADSPDVHGGLVRAFLSDANGQCNCLKLPLEGLRHRG